MKVYCMWLIWMMGIVCVADSAIPQSVMQDIERINNEGSYFGIVVPNSYEMNPLLQSSSFLVDENLPFLDFAGSYFILHNYTDTVIGRDISYRKIKVLVCFLFLVFLFLKLGYIFCENCFYREKTSLSQFFRKIFQILHQINPKYNFKMHV